MKRVLVIGCSGAGKTTFANKLTNKLGVELLSLDQYYWRSGWLEPTNEEWENKLKILLQKDRWIMDGNYGGTMELRMKYTDTIIFLNYKTSICLYRVIKRTIKYWGKTRPEMTQGCIERFDLNFLLYVLNFKQSRASKIIKLLNDNRKDKGMFVFRNDKETNDFLQSLSS